MASKVVLDGYTVGDTAPPWEFEIAESLTGITVEGHLTRPDGTEISPIAAVIDQAEPGPDPAADPAKFHFVIPDTDTLNMKGKYDLRVTFTNGPEIETWRNITVEVKK